VKKMAQLMGQKVEGKQNCGVEAEVSDKPCKSLE